MGGQIIRGLPIDEYHAHPAWSSSKIRVIDTHGPLYAIRKVRGELKPTDEGSLKWTLDLKPGEKRELTVKFAIEYPNDVQVTGLD